MTRMAGTLASEDWRELRHLLDSGSRAPLHAQIAGLLRDRIRKRDLLPGDPLPTEEQLQASCGVSRSVARQAMSTLVAEGLVVRGRGRGSMVAPERQYHRIVNDPAGLYSQIGATGSRISTSVLLLKTERAPRSLPMLGGQEAVRLERLRSLDGLPVAFIRTWLPLALGEGLTAQALHNASLHETLKARHGVTLAGGTRQVRAVSADAVIAQLLGTHVGAPLLLLEGVTLLDDGRLLEHFATWHRGDAVAFDVEMPGSTLPAASSGGTQQPSPEVLQALQQAQASIARLSSLLAAQPPQDPRPLRRGGTSTDPA